MTAVDPDSASGIEQSVPNAEDLDPVAGVAVRHDGELPALRLLGWIATATAVVMYVSYVSQIQLNLAGHRGSAIQPLATAVNCSLWVAYGLMKRQRDWPVALANAPGVLLGAITFVTAL